MDEALLKKRVFQVAHILGWFLCALVALYIISAAKGLEYIGAGQTANTISFTGTGEVSAVPDIATIDFTLSETAPTVKAAQDKVTAKESAALDYLAKQNIDKKDIKTENYNSYPQYDYNTPVCYGGLCPRPGTPKIIGYQVSETVSVKIRDTSKAGGILQGLGSLGISQLSGPNFTVDNEDALKEKARQLAIADAKSKAETLAKDLGVHLVRIVNFSETGNYPMPIYAMGAAKADSAMSAPAPTLPTGENKITSNISITYEIR